MKPSPRSVAKLMAPKPKPIPKPPSSRPHLFKNRMALGAYIADPESYPASVVIYHNADFVVIHDKFPKATVHTLLLPRSPRHSLLHPFEALKDEEFLAKVKIEVEKLKVLAAGELQRRLGAFSRADAAREAVLNGETEVLDDDGGQRKGETTAKTEDEGEDKDRDKDKQPKLPSGRDWAAEIKCGVHAVPSMGHLHIHVLSRDMHSPAMKHRKHYNSFNTPFLVDVADFPLESDDLRRGPREEGFMRRDLVCWRCGENFGNRFKELKEHLEKEFEEWKRE
ncbi:aprataxin [Trichoderma gamsii]|uniref:Aprataxin n=1 Tax=Trichoderma gamsii TaxID=398673 RepID=A0A2P5A147_9HYPO|nr:aprataxin [Trichoderma gamsii]PON30201.1 aprataxin [Trichoderma gamsii]